MRWLALAFGILIVALQYPMWLGKGGHFLAFPVRAGKLINYVGFVPTDEEIVWVGYDSTSRAPTDVWTYWHGKVLHSAWPRTLVEIDVQWGKHGSIPRGMRESELQLGTWQRVLFIELDRERDRRWLVQVVGNE